ncbi:MAG: hypothetical protein QUU85_02255, partial [Candidatus Eisenbacteria bacterium]|nr:hypothetical protein [Candidatus Eisenbacteria bacterium]
RAALALGLALGGKTLPGTRPWSAWTSCAHGRVRDPRAVWVDPFGNVHLCHGVLIGSLWWNSLADLVHGYDPDSDPVLGPLARGGPAALVEEHGLPLRGRFADACHLCFLARRELRGRFPERLGPDAVYGAAEVPEETR